jgi:hypothetical protein
MKNKVLGFVCAAAVATLAGPVLAQDAEVPLADDFAGLSYSIDTRSDIFMYVGIRDVGGKVGVCGVVWTENATNVAKRLEPKFSQKIRFSVAGERLRVNVRKFNRYESEAEATAGLAGCSMTRTAWQAAYANAELEMSLSPTTIAD